MRVESGPSTDFMGFYPPFVLLHSRLQEKGLKLGKEVMGAGNKSLGDSSS